MSDVPGPPSLPRQLDVSTLSDERQVALLSGADDWHTEAAPDLGLDAVMVSDGPHGLRKVESAALADLQASAPATCFPTGSALGATWDTELVGRVGRAIAREALAEDVAVVLGPAVNLKRHPAAGRNFEYYSEDPLLTAELAVAWIDGAQGQGVGTSLKHYAVNNQEANRMIVDAVVDDRSLRELYLLAFEAAVRRSQPWTVMSAYNRLNGVYCSEDPWLLGEVLRDQWGFEGLVMTDWGANADRVAGVLAGQDLEMPGSQGIHDRAVLAAVAAGSLPREDLERCVGRVVALMERSHTQVARRSGGPARQEPGPDLDAVHEEHHRLAREVAAAATVLLTNDGVLPLDPSGHVALIGEFATRPRIQGGGSSQVKATRTDLLLDELRAQVDAAGGRVQYAPGYVLRRRDDGDGEAARRIDEAEAVAQRADVAVVVVGLPDDAESEGFDRSHLHLPEPHQALVRRVVAANPRTVVVVIAGSPVCMSWVDHPAAVVYGYLGGQAAGGALADVLLGAAEPGGRLAETLPVRAADVASNRWFPGEEHQVTYREGPYIGYRWFDAASAEPLFCFGHGLSYAEISLAEPSLSATVVDAAALLGPSGDGTIDPGAVPAPGAGPVAFSVTVPLANASARAGSEVVQVYLEPPDGAGIEPPRGLAAFAKVGLGGGTETTVSIDVPVRAMCHWEANPGGWAVAPGTWGVAVGRSSRNLAHRLEVEVSSGWEPPAADRALDPYRHPHPDDWDPGGAAFEALLGHPVPAPRPVRPFTRNSTLGQLRETPVGRPLLALVRKVVARFTGGNNDEGGLGVMVDRALAELPLRNLAVMSQGRVPIGVIDRLIAVANRAPRWSGRRR
ncbi:MAG: glycoside hydrolase family 3 C-terminal domain-containing protein [Microthrixaceae bacterium]